MPRYSTPRLHPHTSPENCKQSATSILNIIHRGLAVGALIICLSQCKKSEQATPNYAQGNSESVQKKHEKQPIPEQNSDQDGTPGVINAITIDPATAADADLGGQPDSLYTPQPDKSPLTLEPSFNLADLECDLDSRKNAIDTELQKLHTGTIHPEFNASSLLDRIHWELPQLQLAREHYEQQRTEQALEALLDHYREKFGQYRFATSAAPLTQKEQENFFHYFWGDDSTRIYRGAGYDWKSDPVAHREWMIQHDREFGDIALILSAYKKTRSKLFFDEIIARVVSYYEYSYPFHERSGKFAYGVVHPFSTAIRGKYLGLLFRDLVHEPHFDTQVMAYLLNAIYQSFDHVQQNYSKTGNHLTYQLEYIMENGFRFNELKAASMPKTGWIEDSVNRTSQLLFAELYPDGMNRELSPQYHGDYAHKFQRYMELATQYGYKEAYSEDYQNRLNACFDAYFSLYLPDYRKVAFGDAWPIRTSEKNFRYRSDDPKHLYLASRGKKGTFFTNSKLDWAGFFALRSDWNLRPGDRGIGLVMKNGEEAAWHNQPDNLSFELRAYGRTLMSDASQQRYSGNSEITRMREKYRQTRVHNTVTLNEKNTDCKPRLNRWAEDVQHGAFSYDLVEAQNISYPTLRHTRTLLFFDKKYFVLVDILDGKVPGGKLRAHFQFANENEAATQQVFNPAHSKVYSDRFQVVTTMPESGRRAGNLLVQAWQQAGLSLENEMHGLGAEAKGAGFGVNKVNNPEFERRAIAFSLPRKQGRQYFVTALIPFKGDNTSEQSTPKCRLDFDPSKQQVTLVVDQQRYQLRLPQGTTYAVDTDGDGTPNILDPEPYDLP